MPTTFEIHPAIGIARLGSSDGADDFFIGPEPGEQPPATFKNKGQIKRQAARFRVYKCERDAAGVLTAASEITPATGAVTWTVHVANRKGAAPLFVTEGTLPHGTGVPNMNPRLRRNGAQGDDQQDYDLIIDGGTVVVTGPSSPVQNCTGKFQRVAVDLGAVFTDTGGRLLFVPSKGASGSPTNQPVTNGSFADKAGWYDNTSDGFVKASIKLSDGSVVQAKSAWVVTGPPDYAPFVSNIVTMYDAIRDIALFDRGLGAPLPATPAFDLDIFPILKRIEGMQWVSSDAFVGHGPGGKVDIGASLTALADKNSVVGQDMRQRIRNVLTDPFDPQSIGTMPRLFSDDYGDPTLHLKALPLTRMMYRQIVAWCENKFDALGKPAVEQEPDAMTRVALQACVGGAFYPGIEFGLRVRDLAIYQAGEIFRFEPLDPQVYRSDPRFAAPRPRGLRPGELSESMAVPWQGDFTDCADEGTFFWWPAQRPIDVFSTEQSASPDKYWAESISDETDMIDLYGSLGVIKPVEISPDVIKQVEKE